MNKINLYFLVANTLTKKENNNQNIIVDILSKLNSLTNYSIFILFYMILILL
jgi:hypothetical protein